MIDAIIVGAGHRAVGYAEYARRHPERLRIVAVADLLPERREFIAREYGLPSERCFPDLDALLQNGRIGAVAINGTMDCDHVPTTLPLLAAGYDVLLEKPFAVNEAELEQLAAAVRTSGRSVMICHVLRYAPFYAEIKRLALSGAIGEITAVESAEHVSYHHYTMGFVRGKWSEQGRCASSFLLQKCCHDLDLIAWLKSGVAPVAVDSMGSLGYFTAERAPRGSGTHCLLDCAIEPQCDFSVRKLHLDHPVRWHGYVWPQLAYLPGADTPERREAELRRPDHPYSRCVWKCANDQVDRQSVMVEFADGTVASHQMIGNTARPMRKLHLIGTAGEIEGVFDDNRFVLRRRDVRPGAEYTEEWHDIGALGDTTGAYGDHGGGDLRLVEDFLNRVEGRPASVSCTALEDSLTGHRLVFAAERARREGRRVRMDEK